MIRGLAVTENRKPALAFRREWQIAMAAKKAADPTLDAFPLPGWVEIVDEHGVPNAQFLQLARHFKPALTPTRFADAAGRPTDYALSWWKQATA